MKLMLRRRNGGARGKPREKLLSMRSTRSREVGRRRRDVVVMARTMTCELT